MAGRELTNGIKQRFKLNTVGRSPSEIQRDLEQMGVKGFVVYMSPSLNCTTWKQEKDQRHLCIKKHS